MVECIRNRCNSVQIVVVCKKQKEMRIARILGAVKWRRSCGSGGVANERKPRAY